MHLSYAREGTGHALIGARQWIPREQVADPVTSLVTGLPPGLRFRTKGQLAADLLADACADGVTFDFILGDEVYGASPDLRECLESRGQAYVLRVASSFTVTLAGGTTTPAGEPWSYRAISSLTPHWLHGSGFRQAKPPSRSRLPCSPNWRPISPRACT